MALVIQEYWEGSLKEENAMPYCTVCKYRMRVFVGCSVFSIMGGMAQ